MKNISLPSTKEICNDCRDIGYFTENTPRKKGADGFCSNVSPKQTGILFWGNIRTKIIKEI